MHVVRPSWLTGIGLAVPLLVLLAGGLVVSTKIGGGADVHNLDAYMAMLLFITSALFWGQYAPAGQPVIVYSPAYDLHLLGLDHERLTFRHNGRDYRLTDVEGRVIEDILA